MRRLRPAQSAAAARGFPADALMFLETLSLRLRMTCSVRSWGIYRFPSIFPVGESFLQIFPARQHALHSSPADPHVASFFPMFSSPRSDHGSCVRRGRSRGNCLWYRLSRGELKKVVLFVWSPRQILGGIHTCPSTCQEIDQRKLSCVPHVDFVYTYNNNTISISGSNEATRLMRPPRLGGLWRAKGT